MDDEMEIRKKRDELIEVENENIIIIAKEFIKWLT